ncbi:MAG: hypothetical protein ACFCGT_17410 [Sandaracinaceae bacterium]
MTEPTPPPMHQLGLHLWRDGAVEDARELFSWGQRRRGADGARCRALLEALEAGREPPEAPPVEVSLARVGELLDAERLHEARAFLRGSGLDQEADAVRLAFLLDQALAPVPPGADPSFEAVLELVGAGHASTARRAMQNVLERDEGGPAWLVERSTALAQLLDGRWASPSDPAPRPTRGPVVERLRENDLPGALQAARRIGAEDLISILERLVAGSERVSGQRLADVDPAAEPTGHRLAELHLREGHLGLAALAYEEIRQEHPDDERAISRLADIADLRRVLGQATPPPPPRAARSGSALRKSGPRKLNPHAWSAAGGRPSFLARADDETQALDAAREAELLLQLGKAEEALLVYRILCVRAPDESAYRQRLAEIEAVVEARAQRNSAR